jgi:hypothetical protein
VGVAGGGAITTGSGIGAGSSSSGSGSGSSYQNHPRARSSKNCDGCARASACISIRAATLSAESRLDVINAESDPFVRSL